MFGSSTERWKTGAVGIERFEELKSWQEARKLVQMVYRLASKDAFNRDRSLRWQIQDAAVSAMGNIACPVK